MNENVSFLSILTSTGKLEVPSWRNSNQVLGKKFHNFYFSTLMFDQSKPLIFNLFQTDSKFVNFNKTNQDYDFRILLFKISWYKHFTHLRKDCWIEVNLKATVKCENYEIKSLNFRVKSISRSPIADIGPRDPSWARIIHSFS